MGRLLGNGAQQIAPQSQLGAILKKRALGVGSTDPGTLAGRAKAVYAEIDLTSVPDLNNVIVRHALGVAPTLCEYVEARNTGAQVFATIAPVTKNLWTHTTVRVAVNLTGTQSGTVLKLRVGGE
jgi:hypothetical protein